MSVFFEKDLFKCVTRPDLSGVPLSWIYGKFEIYMTRYRTPWLLAKHLPLYDMVNNYAYIKYKRRLEILMIPSCVVIGVVIVVGVVVRLWSLAWLHVSKRTVKQKKGFGFAAKCMSKCFQNAFKHLIYLLYRFIVCSGTRSKVNRILGEMRWCQYPLHQNHNENSHFAFKNHTLLKRKLYSRKITFAHVIILKTH